MGRRNLLSDRRRQGAAPAAAPAFDPASLGMSLWVRTAYAGAPWAGETSTGTSGSRSLAAGPAPAVGANLNGRATASFNGTTHVLVNADTIDQLFTTAYDVFALVNLAALGADATVYDEPAILSDTGGNWGLHVSTSGARLYHFDGGALASGRAVVGTATWTLIRGRWDGAALTIGLNSGALGGSQAAGAPGGIAVNSLKVGANYAGAVFLSGLVAELMVFPSNLSAGNTTNVIGYLNTRHGLSL